VLYKYLIKAFETIKNDEAIQNWFIENGPIISVDMKCSFSAYKNTLADSSFLI